MAHDPIAISFRLEYPKPADRFKLFEIMVNDDAPSLRCCIGRQENIVVVDESMLNLFDKCLDFLLLQLFGL